MIQNPVSIQALRVGEVLTLALGFGMSTLAVLARVYTKTRLTRKMMMEDYFSVLAWLSFLVYIALAVVIGRSDGSTKHIGYLSYVESIIYSPIIVFVKVSILLHYITLLVTHRGTFFHYTVYGLIWINVLYYIIDTLLFIFDCNPRQKEWDPTISGHCFSGLSFGVLSGTINVVSDCSILILPLPLIWRLQISWDKKARIIAVFSVGLFACIASVLRLIYSSELTHVPPMYHGYQLDVDRIGLWALAEIAIGIIIGCLPVLPRFFQHFSSKRDGPSSRFKILSSGNISRISWRRLFRKSITPQPSESCPSDVEQNLIGGKKTPRPKGDAFIETLNLTRSSLQWGENDLPRRPSPVFYHGSLPAPAASQIPTFHAKEDEHIGNERIKDIESAIPYQQNGIDEKWLG